MNHYPHHLGDYAKKTLGFTQGEHGAYRLLLDAYYATEKALPAEEVYTIAKATNAAERKNTDKALKKFDLRDGHYYHERAEAELAAYRVRAETARENGKQPKKKPSDKPVGIPPGKPTASDERSGSEAEAKLASSQKPVNPNPDSEKRFPGGEGTPDSAATLGAAALERLRTPLPMAETRIDSDDNTPAGTLAKVCCDNAIRTTPFHPLVVEWAREGVTVQRLKAAIATARQRKGDGKIPVAYLDPIVRDNSKPVDNSWKRDDATATELCAALGIPGPKRGELAPEFHGRVETALAERARSAVR